MMELNEKLLRFAGFTKTKAGDLKDPNGELHFDWQVDFLHSLDACVKWIWPNFKGVNPDGGAAKSLYFGFDDETGLCTCEIEISGFMGEHRAVGEEAEADEPAMAFCLAAEKLIDSEEVK